MKGMHVRTRLPYTSYYYLIVGTVIAVGAWKCHDPVLENYGNTVVVCGHDLLRKIRENAFRP